MQVSIVPVPSSVQPAGSTASAGLPNASDSAPTATVLSSVSRQFGLDRRTSRRRAASPSRPAIGTYLEAIDIRWFLKDMQRSRASRNLAAGAPVTQTCDDVLIRPTKAGSYWPAG